MGRSFNQASGTVQSFDGAEVLGALVCATLNGNVNNYAPVGAANYSLLQISASTPINITGLTGATANRDLVLMNVGTQVITLKAGSVLSIVGNRFNFQSDVALSQWESIRLIGVVAASGWVLVQDVGASGGAPSTATYVTEADETATLPNSFVLAAGSGITLTPGTNVLTIATSGGGTPPGGADTDVQYNDGGAFGGDAHFLWDKTLQKMTIAGSSNLDGVKLTSVVNGSPRFTALNGGATGYVRMGVADNAVAYVDGQNGLSFMINNVIALTINDVPQTGSGVVTFAASNAPSNIAPTKWLPVQYAGLSYYMCLYR